MAGATEAEILEFEQRHNIRLPGTYREFLASTNGHRPKPRFLMNPEKTRALALVTKLFSLSDIDELLYRFTDRIRDGLLLIGLDGGGNYFFVCLTTGAVYEWDHERVFNEDFKAKDLTWLAESVPSLLSKLEEYSE